MSRPRYRTDPAVLDVEARETAASARIPVGWVSEAAQVIDGLTGDATFTAAGLRQAGVSEPPHAAHWGGLLNHLRGQGRIEAVGLALERVPCGEVRPVRVWRRTTGGGATTE